MPKDYDNSDVQRKLEKFQNLDYVSDRNKELVSDFIAYARADPDISCQRQYKYLYTFKSFFKNFCDKDLDKVDKKDMRKIVGRIRASEYSDWTKWGMITILKKFFRTVYEDDIKDEDTEHTKRVKRILRANFMSTGKKKIENKRDVEALEPEEVMELVEAAENRRDKLLPLLLFETGGRISEVLDIQLEDIELKQKYAEVEIKTLKNDKGPRVLQLTRCVGLLQDWLEKHPRDDNDAYLFANIASSKGSKRGEPLTYENARQILQRLATEAGIDKPVNPHAFRHSAATYYGMKWSVSRLKYWMGWKSSEQAETYCHENKDRMKKARLAEEGINEEENSSDPTERKTCGRCGTKCPPTNNYCSNCSLALDAETAAETKKAKEIAEVIVKERLDGLNDEELREKAEELEITT